MSKSKSPSGHARAKFCLPSPACLMPDWRPALPICRPPGVMQAQGNANFRERRTLRSLPGRPGYFGRRSSGHHRREPLSDPGLHRQYPEWSPHAAYQCHGRRRPQFARLSARPVRDVPESISGDIEPEPEYGLCKSAHRPRRLATRCASPITTTGLANWKRRPLQV
jgi:hypothetical protein